MPRTIPLPTPLLQLADRQAGLVSLAQCRTAGVGSDRCGRLVRSGRWNRVTSGVYAVAPGPPAGPEERRLRAAWTGLLAYGPHAVAVAAGALVLHGVHGLPERVVPEVVLPGLRDAPGRGGVRVRRFSTMSVPHGAGRVAPLPEALVQALPELPREHAVAVLDDVVHRGLLPAAELTRVRAATSGRRGAAGLHRCWALVDGRAESPLETFVRLQCVAGGVPPDAVQLLVRTLAGRVVARADLAWRRRDGTWVLAEVDGRQFHDVPAALLHDRRRQNALAVLGYTVLRFTAADVARRRVAAVVRAALTTTPPTASSTPSAT